MDLINKNIIYQYLLIIHRNNTFLNVLPAVPDTIQPNQCVSVKAINKI